MAYDLTEQFNEGRAARAGAGRCLEHGIPECPYYSSSPAGDAWLAGWSFECDRMAGNEYCARSVVKVWSGRGYSVNVQLQGKGAPKLVYRINESARSPRFASLAA